MFKITEEQAIQLNRIFNTFMTIETSGNNTITMGDCLRAFQQVLQMIQNQRIEETATMAEAE